MQQFDVEADAQRVFYTLAAGGIAVIHLDVAYAVLAHSEAAVRRIYAAKRRSFAKPTGIVGSLDAHDALQILGERERRMVRSIVLDHDLPLAVIAPYRADHPFLARLAPFVLGNATKDGTLNMLLNVGALRTRIAEISWRERLPLVGTSANASLTGSKYRVEDIDAEVLEIADIVIDYGLSRYHNPAGHSSTMIDFAALKVVRAGVCYEQIAAVLRAEFGVDLDATRGQRG